MTTLVAVRRRLADAIAGIPFRINAAQRPQWSPDNGATWREFHFPVHYSSVFGSAISLSRTWETLVTHDFTPGSVTCLAAAEFDLVTVPGNTLLEYRVVIGTSEGKSFKVGTGSSFPGINEPMGAYHVTDVALNSPVTVKVEARTLSGTVGEPTVRAKLDIYG